MHGTLRCGSNYAFDEYRRSSFGVLAGTLVVQDGVVVTHAHRDARAACMADGLECVAVMM